MYYRAVGVAVYARAREERCTMRKLYTSHGRRISLLVAKAQRVAIGFEFLEKKVHRGFAQFASVAISAHCRHGTLATPSI
ncbi:MAG: hypothetical protein FWG10_12965 [Eubacteriaceae bacterium]|nr:hypothetical protein [Eubacteriaceae bacterium]